MPKVTCPNCGTTIDLENRRKIDYGKICQALEKGPKSFTDLLKITGLPRKTLSLRLNYLCESKIVTKNGDYSLNGHSSAQLVKETVQAMDAFNDWKRFVRTFALVFLLTVGTASVVSAFVNMMPITTIPANPPVASVAITPSLPYYIGSTNTLTFDASTSAASNSEIVSYLWKFGDGTTAKGKTVTHTYLKAGNYEVTLLVVDSEGLSTVVKTIVPVLPTPCSRLYIEAPTALKIGDTFTAAVVIEGVTDLTAWQFGINYDPSVLEVELQEIKVYDEYGELTILTKSAFVEGPFLSQGGNTYFVVPQSLQALVPGKIPFHGCTLLGNSTQAVSGSGILAFIRFKCVGSGSSSLTLTDTLLINYDCDLIPIPEGKLEGVQVRVSP
ncbi:MAG: PKD domain-containing protein [Candidatus Bathyarchaeia archaeon]